MSDYFVVWDGRRGGPGGALLFGPEQQTKVAEPMIRSRSTSQLILDALDKRTPQTLRQLCEMTGRNSGQVNATLYDLREAGLVAVIGNAPEKTPAGRKQSLYAAVQR